MGATNPLGTAGYVAAGLELAEQIAQGEMPVPDRVFVAAGTSGTAAGLAVGFRIAGLSTRIVAVSTFGPQWVNRVALQWHARRVATLLARLDRQVPRVHVAWNEVELIHDFVAPGYGIPTPQAEFALAWAAPALRHVKMNTANPTRVPSRSMIYPDPAYMIAYASRNVVTM